MREISRFNYQEKSLKSTVFNRKVFTENVQLSSKVKFSSDFHLKVQIVFFASVCICISVLLKTRN